MKLIRYKNKGLGKLENWIDEFLADMFKSNNGKRGIGIKYDEESSFKELVWASVDEESKVKDRSKLEENDVNILELVPESPKKISLHRCTNVSSSINIIMSIHAHIT